MRFVGVYYGKHITKYFRICTWNIFSFIIMPRLLFCGVAVDQARPENDLTKMPRSSFKMNPISRNTTYHLSVLKMANLANNQKERKK